MKTLSNLYLILLGQLALNLSNHFTVTLSPIWNYVVPQFKIVGTRKKRKERKKIRVRDVSDREVSAVIEAGIKPKVTKKDIHIILRFLIPSPL